MRIMPAVRDIDIQALVRQRIQHLENNTNRFQRALINTSRGARGASDCFDREEDLEIPEETKF